MCTREWNSFCIHGSKFNNNVTKDSILLASVLHIYIAKYYQIVPCHVFVPFSE